MSVKLSVSPGIIGIAFYIMGFRILVFPTQKKEFARPTF